MAEDIKITCNRIPFKSDDGCDRGDLDITQFSALPMCRIVDPTKADAAIPQVDYPVVPFNPPPCQCIDVDVVSKDLVIESRKDIKLNVDFKSKGDCCEGNYEADIDLAIPCIAFTIDGGTGGSSGGDTVEVLDCDAEPYAIFSMSAGVKDCAITLSPQLKIGIPKPKTYSFDAATNFTTGCNIPARASLTPEIEGDPCSPKVKYTLDIAIPQPPTYSFAGNVELCSGPKEAKMDIYTLGEDCEKLVMMDLKLCIPDVEVPCICKKWKLKITGDLGAKGKISTGQEEEEEEEGANSTCICPEIELDIPCPITEGNIFVSASIGWGGPQTSTAVLADLEKCNITPMSGNLNLGLPCPISGEDQTIKLEVNAFGKAVGGSMEATVGHVNKQKTTTPEGETKYEDGGCGLEGGEGTISFSIPCPKRELKADGKYIKVEPILASTDGGQGGEGECPGWELKFDPTGGSSGGGKDNFTAVTLVTCTSAGGICVGTSTFTVDFIKHTITKKDNGECSGNAAKAAATGIARDLLTATLTAIHNDPTLLAVVDDPTSETAKRALARLGITDDAGITDAQETDISDLLLD